MDDDCAVVCQLSVLAKLLSRSIQVEYQANSNSNAMIAHVSLLVIALAVRFLSSLASIRNSVNLDRSYQCRFLVSMTQYADAALTNIHQPQDAVTTPLGLFQHFNTFFLDSIPRRKCLQL